MPPGNGHNVQAPYTPLHVFIGTWNMHGKLPPVELDTFIPRPSAQDDAPDVYVIGSQECQHSIRRSFFVSSKERWVAALTAHLGDAFVPFAQETLVATHVVGFIRAELFEHISELETATVATGVGAVLGNKGGVGISFMYGATSYVFVNSHLAAHQHEVKQRNRDYNRIDRKMELCERLRVAKTRVSERFQRVFWMGDLNYRVDMTPEEAEAALLGKDYAAMFERDQLRQQIAQGRVFRGFVEGDVSFPPTYKFNPGSDVYAGLKEDEEPEPNAETSSLYRIPSWTDRILYRPQPEVELLEYDSAREMLFSDHKPVFARFRVHQEPETNRPTRAMTRSYSEVFHEVMEARAAEQARLDEELRELEHEAVEHSTKAVLLSPRARATKRRLQLEDANWDEGDPQKILNVFVGTWNMNGKPAANDDGELGFFIPAGDESFDLFVLGTEECENSIGKSLIFRSKEQWVAQLCAHLNADREVDVAEEPKPYVMLAQQSLVATHIVLFVRRTLLDRVSNVGVGSVATGVGDVLGNKGGVAVGLHIDGTSLLFVNCHLAAGQAHVKRRNLGFAKVNARMTLSDPGLEAGRRKKRRHARRKSSRSRDTSAGSPRLELPGTVDEEEGDGEAVVPSPSSSPDPAAATLDVEEDEEESPGGINDEFDCVFWLGDFNYRVNATRTMADTLLEHGMLEVMLANDELAREMQRGHVFQGFEEAPLTFVPTYKYDAGTNVYDTSKKQRVPSWTDRILHKTNPLRIVQHDYNSVPELKSSDHKPVYAWYSVRTGHVAAASDTDGDDTEGEDDAPLLPLRTRTKASVCVIQ